MPKFVVGFISAIFALAIGFACGALLTKPENSQMEALVDKIKVLEENTRHLDGELITLEESLVKQEQQNKELKDKLLNSYDQMESLRSADSTLKY